MGKYENRLERRCSRRRSFRGAVLVSELGGGPVLKEETIDVSGGGLRVSLPRQLTRDAVARVVFPRNTKAPQQPGRTIIGHVVQSRAECGRHVVRIAFGWDAAGKADSSVQQVGAGRSLFHRFWRRAIPVASSSSRKH
jgi:hypothetical protein